MHFLVVLFVQQLHVGPGTQVRVTLSQHVSVALAYSQSFPKTRSARASPTKSISSSSTSGFTELVVKRSSNVHRPTR